jgi:hypothetical protein
MRAIRKYARTWWTSPAVAAAAAAFFAGMTSVWAAADLEDGVSTAAGEFKKILKIGAAAAAVVIVVGGLMITAFKFTQKDPGSIWYLAGTVAGGVLCGVAAGML